MEQTNKKVKIEETETKEACDTNEANEPPLCSKCNEFYANEGSGLCSQCKGIELKIIPELDFVKEWADFAKRYLVKNKILSENMYSSFYEYIKDLPSGEIYAKMAGLIPTDFGPVMIGATLADQLFEYIFSKQPSSEYYRYIHAIAPFVFDRWELRTKNSLLLCYWTDFGEMRKPHYRTDVFKIWGRILGYNDFLLDYQNTEIVQECVCCFKSIWLHDKFSRCSGCGISIHYSCHKSYVISNNCKKCVQCRQEARFALYGVRDYLHIQDTCGKCKKPRVVMERGRIQCKYCAEFYHKECVPDGCINDSCFGFGKSIV